MRPQSQPVWSQHVRSQHVRASRGSGALLLLLPLLALAALGGCRSPYVETDVRNDSSQTISLLEVDYPSASFGTESLAANSVYHYRFNIIGSGPTKVLWTDAQHKDHTVTGPTLQQGEHGTMLITIAASGATWTTQLQP